jgi:hypothetical protein
VISIRNSLRVFIVLNLTVWAGADAAQDFSKFDNESELLQIVRKIPASDKSANAAGYARLLTLNPNKSLYWDKYERYSGNNERGLFNIVKAIPASNRSANAAGYARLLSLNPNNEMYRTKFAKYSAQPRRPASVGSTSDLESFLTGSWCVLDADPTYVAGAHVHKLIILTDGNYRLFSKPASALSWTAAKQKGKMVFREGRHPETGERYFFAAPKEFGFPKLIVDANDSKVFWHQVIRDLGETSRADCSKFD